MAAMGWWAQALPRASLRHARAQDPVAGDTREKPSAARRPHNRGTALAQRNRRAARWVSHPAVPSSRWPPRLAGTTPERRCMLADSGGNSDRTYVPPARRRMLLGHYRPLERSSPSMAYTLVGTT